MGRLTTPLCDRLDIDVPVIQAPIGSATTPQLAAAVSNAGGLGTIAISWRNLDDVERMITATQSLTQRPFGVNVVLAFPATERLSVALAFGVPIVMTAWGDPALVRQQISESGAIHLHACGSVAEAVHAASVGVDGVIAQGWEAGGHVIGTTASLALIPAVVDAVAPLPVIAAGGIADGRGLAAALVLGAQAALLGTRFVASAEAHADAVWRQQIVDAQPDAAVYTNAFDGGWPGAPHRVLRNSTLERWQTAGMPASPNRPGEGDEIAVDAAGRVWRRYDDIMPLPGMTGALEELALYAGQSSGLIHEVRGAAELVHDIERDAIASLNCY